MLYVSFEAPEPPTFKSRGGVNVSPISPRKGRGVYLDGVGIPLKREFAMRPQG
jgi:hypothetical protein